MEYSYNKCLYGNGRPTEFCIFFKIHCPYIGGNNLFFNLIILSARERTLSWKFLWKSQAMLEIMCIFVAAIIRITSIAYQWNN